LAESALDPSEPFSTPFVVSNDYVLAATSVDVRCYLNALDFELNVRVRRVGARSIATISRIGPFDKQTVYCKPMMDFAEHRLLRGDISITMHFRLPLYPWPVTKQARFVTAKAADGQLRWLRHRLID